MGSKITIENIECLRDMYQIDFIDTETKVMTRAFIRRDALFALLTVAEKEFIKQVDGN